MTILLIVFFVLGMLSGIFEKRDLKAAEIEKANQPYKAEQEKQDVTARRQAAINARRNNRQ